MRIKMAGASHSDLSVLCLVTFIYIVCLSLVSAAASSKNSFHSQRIRRNTIEYDLDMAQPQTFPENAPDNTILYDFKTVNIGDKPVSSFNLKVVTTADSQPPSASVFQIVDSQLVFSTSISTEDRKNYFDYEQYRKVVIVIEAIPINSGDDKKLIKLTIPLSDVNDELPVLKNQPKPYLASIVPDARAGDTVYILLAEDPDRNADLDYAIDFDQLSAGSIIRSVFRMDNVVDDTGSEVKQGHLVISSPGTFTLGDRFTIPVRIQDRHGILPQIITAEVDVLVGPRPPQFFQQSYEGSIFETETRNNPVLLTGSGSADELIIKVHQFQQNFPIVLSLLQDNNKVSTQFRIDNNGKVYNIGSLEFDIQRSARPLRIQLLVKVVETSDDTTVLENTVPLTITIKDENDNPPRFQLTQYLKTIPEDSKPGTSILSVIAEDSDSGKNAEVHYTIVNDYFRIERRVEDGKTYGDIYVKGFLDYDAEPGPTYRFTVIASDSGSPVLSSSVDVFITTSNVNDERPVFERQDSLVLRDDFLDVGSGPYILTRMRAKDKDGDGVKFYFSNPAKGERLTRIEIFEIKPKSGIIQAISPVPSNIDSYYLNVTAVDDGRCCPNSTPLTDETSFVVEIVDSVNQKPTFDKCQEYILKASLKEESKIGTSVITVKATDSGRGVNGMLEYSIQSPDPKLPGANFEINKDTGEITIKNPIDREPNVNFKQITVKAADKAEVPQEGWCTFRVQVEDINDNAPTFTRKYNQEVSSTAQRGRVILRVGATDRDIGDNARLAYSLIEDGDEVFGIYPETGIIFMKNRLKGNVRNYDLIVKAEDHGNPPKNGTVEVHIKITDDEDSDPPKFIPAQANYVYSVAENVDITSRDAVITTLQCESNNADPSVQFLIVSEEGNLYPSQFDKFAIKSFKQNSANLVNVSVAQNLDYETTRQHKIIIRCQNFAKLTLYEEVTLTVNVIDKNDKVPYFAGLLTTTGRYVGTVPENTKEPFIIMDNIQGYDDDSSQKFNQLHFSLDATNYPNVNDDFEIIPLEGNKASIRTKHEFDREKKDHYIVTVRIDDKEPSDLPSSAPGTPNTAIAIVEITIGDKNDNPMKFKQNLYTHSVKETANIGDIVFAVTADDPDEVDKGRLMYSFSDGDIPFDIKDQTGEIFVINKLDFEEGRKEYRLTLESRDTLNLFRDTTEVLITVTDENDNVPIFKETEYVIKNKVKEEDSSINRDNPKLLVTVEATDADVDRKETEIRYRLLGKGTEPGDQQIFTINEETGEIHLVATLDRDTNPEYIFTVEALDERTDPQKGYVNVKVFPIDINDNKPQFDRKSLTDSVDEGTEEGGFIAQVKATDIDAGKNAEIDYEIINSPATTDALKTHYFRIEKGGEIYSQVSADYLDRETYPEFKVVIRAKDKGDQPLSSTATLTIKLNDKNDNVPEFTEDLYTVLMSENTESGIIKEVVATDQDIGKNAALRYILPADANQNNKHFTITYNNNKGYISISNPVDYEKVEQRQFELIVVVKDSNDAHRDTATVSISVEDFNDNAPKFDKPFQTEEIEEGRLPGENVTTFTATDIDSGINALKSYQIDGRSDPRREFYIDPDTGLVQTRKTLDREVSPTLSVVILAIDQGDPRQTGTATLSVIVKDVNDNFPIFKEDYRPVVEENQEDADFPLLVQEVFAIDLDTPYFGPNFGFALPVPCTNIACEKFQLEFKPDHDEGRGTAIIRTSSVFDREQQKEYHLPIVMWDMRGKGAPEAQTGTNTLTIIIGDVNDNEPFPGHQDIFVYNYKGLFGSFVIGRVFVKDQDDWDLPDKTFTFVSPSSLRNSFIVDKDTGDITMADGVKSNDGQAPYKFEVDVLDKKFQKTVRCTVAVTVKELSEEAVMKSGSVRLSGMTGAQFIQEPTNSSTGQKQDSLYTKFRSLMASKLGYAGVDNVEITTLRDADHYLEVRYAAHGSPYLTPAEVDNAIILNKDAFENLGLTVMSIPVDECEDEIFEGGCYNKLNITGKPVTINSNGTSYVGVDAFLVATEGCQADVFPVSNECSGDYCYNGGTCHKDAWGTLSCKNCPSGFTGSRCQERRHGFDGNSIAFYKTLLQCEESQTSIEFATKQEDGVILYNGPIDTFDPLKSPQDFILLKLEGGYPTLVIDHGTGPVTLKLDGRDKAGNQMLQKLNDGEWHHLDINRHGKSVELVVDRCAAAEAPSLTVVDDRACRVQAETPGINKFLNVKTLLQLGGVRQLAPLDHLKGLSMTGFNGCMRNLIHNKELYNLHYRPLKDINTGANGCPFEDTACGTGTNAPKCGLNGQCEATMDNYVTCICNSGYYGKTCNKRTTVRDFDKEVQSYYYWQIKDQLFNTMIKNRELKAHIRFRSRQRFGNLMYLYDPTSSPPQDIQLRLHNGKVRLSYNLGGGDKHLELVNAQADNGQWHTLTMERYGTEFHLRLDNGEGRNYVYTLGDRSGGERQVFRLRRHIYSGGYKENINGRLVFKDALKSTCIDDVRINNGYFAMTNSENSDPDTFAEMVENPATKEGCSRDDCPEGRCNGKMCVPLWEYHDCRCFPGYKMEGNACQSICIPNPCYNNVTCKVVDAAISCVCPAGWRGRLCDEKNPEGVQSGDLSGGAWAAIGGAIILVILIVIIVVLLYKFCGTSDEGQKFILEVDPEDDIRENVINYDEEGAGEEDQDAYDISRLQKPSYETSNRPYDPDKRRDIHRRDAPTDKPDVGIFIDDRLRDADDDGGAPPHDSVREFTFEGGDSDAGSLSSLNTSSSDRSQDYDYLNEWGPKFAKLADMYGAGQDLES